ncbi:hypothetical protein GUJ93_ZPchr0004g38391 [Zizania palustris]|uniref:BHLH domain-containing protein n=1 Tax=Zizania palustris TaxID=103762 RepID=A0A8J5SP98_ZIZPA|nr:hypothetical protein GUJ93_ZPchr0004g38391 [Zizania palustris]
MGDHQMMRAAPAMYGGGGGVVSQGVWWNTTAAPAVTCSTELAGFAAWSNALAASYGMAAADDVVGGGGKARSAATASSESPGNNDSSITFQEPTSVGAAVTQPAMVGFTDWGQPYMNSGAGLHEFLQDGHHDMSLSNNLGLHQGHHEPQAADHHHHQMRSSFGSDLLLSPTSPYGFQSSLLMSSLMESTTTPAAPVTTTSANPAALAGLQQYQYHRQMGQTQTPPSASFAQAAAPIRETLQFTNEAPFWNPSAAGLGMAAAAPDQAIARSIKRSSPAPPRAATHALKSALEGVGDSSSVIAKKVNGEPAFKKPRLETPSPLPTFKVRKEKLGDRITALQQLVSPFGKTDTASVLHETIEYIKFLHDQVGVSVFNFASTAP